MRINSVLRVAIASLVLALCLSSCMAPPSSEEQTTAPAVKDDFKPAVDDSGESELAKRYAEYKEKASLAFQNTPVTPSSDLEYEIGDNGVTVTGYTGESDIVVIPDEIDGICVTGIGENAIAGANVRAIYVPDTVQTVGAGALAGCTALSTLRLPSSLGGEDCKYLGYIFGADEYAENAVRVPTTLDMVIVGEGADEIPDNYFSGCKTLSALVLPKTVTKIGKFAAYECRDLVYVELGEGIQSIGAYAFAFCDSLFSLDCGGADVEKGALYGCRSISTLAVSLDTKHIGYVFDAESADYNDEFVPTSLRTVIINENDTKIGTRAFASCKYITSVILPEGLDTVGVRAFYNCRSLGKIALPESVRIIDDDAFFGCDALASVELGAELVKIGMQAFFGCKKLNSITIPSGVTEIKASTFYGCSSLLSVELGGVKKIGKDAFYGCSSLTPRSLDGIEVAEGNGALAAE